MRRMIPQLRHRLHTPTHLKTDPSGAAFRPYVKKTGEI